MHKSSQLLADKKMCLRIVKVSHENEDIFGYGKSCNNCSPLLLPNNTFTIKPYETPINFQKFKNNDLKLISNELIFSNTGEAIVINKDYTKGLVLRGYSNNDFSKLEIIKQGNFIGDTNTLIDNNISIGKELSFSLNINIDDKISIMSPSSIETIVGNLPKQQTFVVSSIFDSGLADFDQNVAFININTLENFFDLSIDDRNLEIYLKNPQNI